MDKKYVIIHSTEALTQNVHGIIMKHNYMTFDRCRTVERRN